MLSMFTPPTTATDTLLSSPLTVVKAFCFAEAEECLFITSTNVPPYFRFGLVTTGSVPLLSPSHIYLHLPRLTIYFHRGLLFVP